MSNIRIPWWKCGLIGGVTLSLITVIKIVKLFVALGTPTSTTNTALEIVGFGLFLFATGFASGVALWLVQRFIRGPAWLSDAISGLVVLEVFFVCCAALFDPSSLTTNQAQGRPMLILAGIIGLIMGPWLGKDMRKGK